MKVVRASRKTSNETSTSFNDVRIYLRLENPIIQNKSILYSKMKSISSGKLKLPIPLSKISKKCHQFIVGTDGKLKHEYSIF